VSKSRQTVTVLADNFAARCAALERIQARRPPPKVLTYRGAAPGGQDLVIRVPADTDRLPPATLGEWVDDREIAALSLRRRLFPAEEAVFAIAEAARTGDLEQVRAAVRAEGARLDDLGRWSVYLVLVLWREKAGNVAAAVTDTAVREWRARFGERRPRIRARRVVLAGPDD
jgi:hypothetical protein